MGIKMARNREGFIQAVGDIDVRISQIRTGPPTGKEKS